jgi:hypothetical protein
MTHTSRSENVDIEAVTLGIVQVFLSLDRFEQRLSLELYRLLSGGQPVARADLAARLQVSVDIVNRILDGWPGVFPDSERRIVGYWGLSIGEGLRQPSSTHDRWAKALGMVRVGHALSTSLTRQNCRR